MNLSRTRGIVTFVGPVAAGKTTLILSVRSYLKRNDVNVAFFAYKTHLVTFARLMRRLSPNNHYSVYQRVFGVLALFDLVALLSETAFLFILSRFMVVLVEDGLIGTLNDYAYISRIYLRKASSSRAALRIILTSLLAFRPACIIYLDVDADESARRQQLRGDSSLEHRSYLRFQSEFLRYLAILVAKNTESGLLLVDTSQGTATSESVEVIERVFPKHDR